MTTSATPLPRRIVLAIASGDLSLTAAALKTGIPRSSLARRLAVLVASGEAPDTLLRFRKIQAHYDTIEPGSVPSASSVRMTRKLKETTARARAAETDLDEARRLHEIIDSLTSEPASPPSWLVAHDSIDHILDPQSRESTPILCLGDWHYGEVTDPRTSGGYRYDPAIAERRIEQTVRTAIAMCRDHLSGLRYPGIVVALLGDMTSGALHPELAESDAYGIMEGSFKAADLIIAAITTLAGEFGRVYVPTAVGNHGRFLDRKPRCKEYARRNTDYWIYVLVARHFANDDRVTVDIQDDGETVFRIYDQTILVTHGDRIGARGGDGIIGAIGPIMRGSIKTSTAYASQGVGLTHMIMGHYHQHLALRAVTVNGCPKGPDEYATAALRAPAEDPSQTLIMVHPRHGVTFRIPIYLKDEDCPDRRKESVAGRWVEVMGKAA